MATYKIQQTVEIAMQVEIQADTLEKAMELATYSSDWEKVDGSETFIDAFYFSTDDGMEWEKYEGGKKWLRSLFKKNRNVAGLLLFGSITQFAPFTLTRIVFKCAAFADRITKLAKVMAILETQNFTFYAFADSKEEALGLMRKRWILHQKQTGASYTFSEMLDSVFCVAIQAGAYERSQLPKPTKKKGN